MDMDFIVSENTSKFYPSTNQFAFENWKLFSTKGTFSLSC